MSTPTAGKRCNASEVTCYVQRMPTKKPRYELTETADSRAVRAARLDVLQRVSGAYSGMYEPGYLDGLREEWPE